MNKCDLYIEKMFDDKVPVVGPFRGMLSCDCSFGVVLSDVNFEVVPYRWFYWCREDNCVFLDKKQFILSLRHDAIDIIRSSYNYRDLPSRFWYTYSPSTIYPSVVCGSFVRARNYAVCCSGVLCCVEKIEKGRRLNMSACANLAKISRLPLSEIERSHEREQSMIF